ncbi:hypothetical protein RRG08_000240 [Elysia crispata]|uniref:Uncharacterized protein n=1 Tax=Elysia crispata TaxID=231223 RepID=A0AAE1AWU6_9GAST|nr:hypothetical protein RRG08_000240 [Elysia crispata]
MPTFPPKKGRGRLFFFEGGDLMFCPWHQGGKATLPKTIDGALAGLSAALGGDAIFDLRFCLGTKIALCATFDMNRFREGVPRLMVAPGDQAEAPPSKSRDHCEATPPISTPPTRVSFAIPKGNLVVKRGEATFEGGHAQGKRRIRRGPLKVSPWDIPPMQHFLRNLLREGLTISPVTASLIRRGFPPPLCQSGRTSNRGAKGFLPLQVARINKRHLCNSFDVDLGHIARFNILALKGKENQFQSPFGDVYDFGGVGRAKANPARWFSEAQKGCPRGEATGAKANGFPSVGLTHHAKHPPIKDRRRDLGFGSRPPSRAPLGGIVEQPLPSGNLFEATPPMKRTGGAATIRASLASPAPRGSNLPDAKRGPPGRGGFRGDCQRGVVTGLFPTPFHFEGEPRRGLRPLNVSINLNNPLVEEVCLEGRALFLPPPDCNNPARQGQGIPRAIDAFEGVKPPSTKGKETFAPLRKVGKAKDSPRASEGATIVKISFCGEREGQP